MANIYTVKLLKNGQLIQQRQVHAALAESTGAIRIKAQSDVVYVLSSESSKKAVTKIVSKRVGNDLQLVLDDSISGKPQLIIEDYFAPNQNSALATLESEGELVLFSPDNAAQMQTIAEPNEVVALTAKGADTAWWSSAGVQLALIAGGLYAVSESKSKSTDNNIQQTAQNSINAYATGVAQASTPTEATFKDAGYSGVTASNVGAINSAIQRTRAKDNASIQKVIAAYQKLIDKANGNTADTSTNDPTLADYQTLGVVLLNIERSGNNNPLDLLNDIIKSRTLGDINNVTKLDAFASIADKIMLLAKGDVPPSPLTTAELNSIGLSDVTDTNIAAIRSAIGASADDGTGVKTVSQLKDIQSAYLKVLALADSSRGNTTEASKTPTMSELQTLGVTLGKAGSTNDGQQANALKLLNDVMDGLSNAGVDTVAEISALAASIDKVMGIATAPTSAAANAFGLTVSELSALGLSSVNTDNLSQVVEAIRLTQSTDGSKVNSFKQMQSAVDLGVIMQYAESSPTAPTGRVAPTVAQYLSAGLTSVDVGKNKAITLSNLSAVNTAVEALTANDVNGLTKLQNVVNAYAKIFTLADGTKANATEATLRPTASDLQALGVTSGKAGNTNDGQQANALKLLNDVMDGLSNAGVDTVAEISALAASIDKVMGIATAPTSAAANAFGLTVSELSALGLSSVNTDNLSQVVEAIRLTQSTDGSKVNSFKQMQSAVDLGVIMQYAESSPTAPTGHVAPTVSQYLSAGLSSVDIGVNKAINLNNLLAINSAVEALNATDVNSLSKLQAVVNTYSKLLNMADGTKANTSDVLTLADYLGIGALTRFDSNTGAVDGPLTAKAAITDSAQKEAALNLLNTVIDGRSANQVDSIAELNLLSVAVDKVLDQAIPNTSTTLKVTDFALLGIQNVNDTNLAQVVTNLKSASDQHANGDTIDTLAEIQSNVSLAALQLYADNPANALPTQTSSITQLYKDLILNTTSISWTDNLATSVSSVVNFLGKSDITTSKLQNIATAYQSVLLEASSGVSNNNPNPSAAQYKEILKLPSETSVIHLYETATDDTTITSLNSNALALLNDVVKQKNANQLTNLNTLETYARVVDKLMNLTEATDTTNSQLTITDLTNLGFTVNNAWGSSSTPGINGFSSKVALFVDHGASIRTWDQVQTLISQSNVF